ncbi:hypothetical protein FGO68_gene1120 [Halteria grandinella]|uniref:Uncharacterized protein n=1 Tax=Halteria grandinella TaxID=5974 RepID=A0A8J8SUT5_HALGN|nr:hypothetical protein FGO68_gene1120 [Halteria grandinella]
MLNYITISRQVLTYCNYLAVEAKIPGSFCLVNHFTPSPSIGAFEITHQSIMKKYIRQNNLFEEEFRAISVH